MSLNNLLKTSKNGLEFISKWEGCILKPYKDIAGLRTIGIGHLIKPNDSFPDGIEITNERALELLASDVKICEDSIKICITVALNQNQFDSLVSFGFNCGTGVYLRSDACKALNQGKYDEVPLRLLAWSKARINGVLQVNQGLYNRRKSEGELFSRNLEQTITLTQTPLFVTWTKESLIKAQEKLAKLCLYKVKIDGLWGTNTNTALQTFAKQKGLSLGANPKKEIPIEIYETLMTL